MTELKLTGDFYYEWWSHMVEDIPIITRLFGWRKIVSSDHYSIGYAKEKNKVVVYFNGRLIAEQRKKITREEVQAMFRRRKYD